MRQATKARWAVGLCAAALAAGGCQTMDSAWEGTTDLWASSTGWIAGGNKVNWDKAKAPTGRYPAKDVADRQIVLGQATTLDGLRVVPLNVELRRVDRSVTLWDRATGELSRGWERSDRPMLVLNLRLENTTDGRALSPLNHQLASWAAVQDDLGHTMAPRVSSPGAPGPTSRAGDFRHQELIEGPGVIEPGQAQTVALYAEAPAAEDQAKAYRWRLYFQLEPDERFDFEADALGNAVYVLFRPKDIDDHTEG